ncbi:hypothetical protein ACLOAV_002540 [Pseudogymnoascus australis]
MAAPRNGEFDAALEQFNRETQDENVRLRGENVRLRALTLLQQQHLEVCHDKYGDDCHEPYVKPDDWVKQLRESGFTREAKLLRQIYKAACRQHNMSCNSQNHGLHYVPPHDRRVRRERTVANTAEGFQDGKFFNFTGIMKEYPKIAIKIISYTMVRHAVVSVVARFDVHDVYPPTQGGLDRKTGLSYRFHWGSKACAINSAPLPRDVMAPMFVCRDWYEMFGTAFYHLNAFSFESLGEFQIFCDKTPDQCLERILTIMITWIGSRMATSNPRKKGPRYCPSRHGMHVLNKLINLRTFEIRIDETSPDRVRRKHEDGVKKKPLKKATKDHHNYTGYRCFRTIRGLDSITQLRGLKRLEVFNYRRSYPRATIRDRTFLEDTRRQVYSPKTGADKAKADLKTLKPLWKRTGPDNWVMSEEVRTIVHGIFDLRPDGEEDERAGIAGDDSDDDNDGGGDDNLNPGDGNDTEEDDDDVQGGHNNHNRDDDDSDEDEDDAPDKGGNASRETPVVAEAGNFADGGGDYNGGGDDIPMDGPDGNQGIKPGDNSDDGSSDFTGASRLSSINLEEDDELRFIRATTSPAQAIDLSQLPDLEDPDTVFPSIEGQETEVKLEDPTGAEGMDSIPILEERPGLRRRSSSPFEPMSPRRGQTEQSSLFVRQSPSPRRSVSSRFLGYHGPSNPERKRSLDDMKDEDDDDDDVDGPPSLRRRLSNMSVDEDEAQE